MCKLVNGDNNVPFFSLEEKGQTALGPALLLSVLLASRVPGSKVHPRACVDTYKIQIVVCVLHKQVIICTDGLANRGVGSLDG